MRCSLTYEIIEMILASFSLRFLPVLKDMPTKYIYEPWLAPLEVQRKAKCIVGQDYPRPIADHAVASKACIARISAAYRAGK
jgi:cryptochrome